jgi:HSP20 family molecular chaperone IbpA
LKLSNKQQVQIELELKNVTVPSMEPLWFICPKHELPDTVTLSKNLGFNQDGSVYVDFSSQFVPNINIVRLNDNGDVSIRIECPSCVGVTANQQGMTSILIQGEKIDEPFQKQYLNTRRVGKFEMEISLDGLEKGLVLSISEMKTVFADGVITITVPSNKSKKKIMADEL